MGNREIDKINQSAYEEINAYENLALYETEGLGDMVKSETTQIVNDEIERIKRDPILCKLFG